MFEDVERPVRDLLGPLPWDHHDAAGVPHDPITRPNALATGVVEAAKKMNIQLPIVLRLEGTNVEEGKKILMDSGLNFTVAETMKDAAEKVVAAREKK